MANSFSQISEQLSSKGIKPSYQRLRIMNYLMENLTHPSAIEIYEALIDSIPSLSKTTVYNTLHLFTEHGILREIKLNDNDLRYDINTHNHVHFYCMECECILDKDPINLSVFEGWKDIKVEQVEVYVSGYCEECQRIRAERERMQGTSTKQTIA